MIRDDFTDKKCFQLALLFRQTISLWLLSTLLFPGPFLPSFQVLRKHVYAKMFSKILISVRKNIIPSFMSKVFLPNYATSSRIRTISRSSYPNWNSNLIKLPPATVKSVPLFWSLICDPFPFHVQIMWSLRQASQPHAAHLSLDPKTVFLTRRELAFLLLEESRMFNTRTDYSSLKTVHLSLCASSEVLLLHKRNGLGELMNLLVLIFQLFVQFNFNTLKTYTHLALVLSEDLANWKTKSFTVSLEFVKLSNFLPLWMDPDLSETGAISDAAAVLLPALCVYTDILLPTQQHTRVTWNSTAPKQCALPSPQRLVVHQALTLSIQWGLGSWRP